MVLQIDPESSIVVRAAAATILYLHIGGGLAAIASGAGALIFRKGSPLHRWSGNVFFVSMLVMASIGAAVSPFLPVPSWLNVVAGTFTLYLVLTAWLTVQRNHRIGSFERGAFVAACLLVIGCLLVGFNALANPTDDASQGPFPAFLFATIATLAAIGDFRLLRRGSLSNTQRLIRHLWRMCYSLFIAVGSLFLGQPQVFPEAMRGTGLLFVPVIAVLLTMIFWLIKVRFFTKRPQPLAQAAGY